MQNFMFSFQFMVVTIETLYGDHKYT